MVERSDGRAGGRASRELWLASTAIAAGFVGLLMQSGAASAACDVTGSIIECTGTTPWPGYGDGSQSNQTITVGVGATVLGGGAPPAGQTNVDASGNPLPNPIAAMVLGADNNVNNGGSITGGIDAINSTGNILVNNTATIKANGGSAIFSGGDANVNTTGTLSGYFGVNAAGIANVVNSGTISGPTKGTFEGIKGDTVKLVNSGTISTAYVGVDAGAGGANIINQGRIAVSEALSAAISSNGGLVLDNSGQINGSVSTLVGNASVANKGLIDGGKNIAVYTADTVTLNNAGQITSAGPGISTIGASVVQLTNTGRITSTGKAGEGVTAYTDLTGMNSSVISAVDDGIAVHAFRDMNLVNTGTISVGNTTSTTTQATAVEADNVLTLVNKGNIFTGSKGANVAIQAGGAANIDNQTQITATGDNSFGIFSGGDLTLTNSGKLTAIGVGSTAAYAGGSANITNTQAITADNTALSAKYMLTVLNKAQITAGATGLSAGMDVILNNSGTITAPIGVQAAGIANVTNSGAINASGTGSLGVTADKAVNVNNSGTITGETGILVTTGGASSTIVNSGKIIGTSGTAIQLSTGSDTVTLKETSKVQGVIALGGGGDTVNVETGKSTSSKVIEFDSLDGAKVNISDNRSGLVVGNSIVIVDTTDFIVADSALMDVTATVSNLTQRRTGNASAIAPGDTTKGFWVQGIGGGSRHQATNTVNGWINGFGGMIGGYEAAPYADFRVGGFAGGAMGVSRLSQGVGDTVTSTYAFAGLYGRYQPNAFFVDFNVASGFVQNSSIRTVDSNVASGGTERATARNNGVFITPQVGFGYRHQYDQSGTITPSTRVRYLMAQYGSYEESGTTTPIAMGGRSYQAVETRTEIEFARARRSANGSGFRAYQTIGLMSQTRLTAGVMNATINDLPMAIATPGNRTGMGAYFGSGIEYQSARGATLFANFEAQVRMDRSVSGNARAGAIWSF